MVIKIRGVKGMTYLRAAQDHHSMDRILEKLWGLSGKKSSEKWESYSG